MKQKIFRNVVVVVVFIVLTVPLLSPGQKTTQPTPQANQDTPNQVTYRMTFSEDDLSFDTILGYDRVQLKEGGYLNDIGKPMMPIKEITIALPQDMKVTHVQVVDVQRRAIEGTYSIVPAQPPRTINDDQPIPFTDPDTTIYV